MLAVAGEPFWTSKKNFLSVALVLGISFMVYLPCLQSQFVNWDDHFNVYENPYVAEVADWSGFLENAKGIFRTPTGFSYNPLTILSFSVDKLLFGLDSPGWWHLNNILLHLLSTFLVLRITSALGLKLIPAAFCALLFGIHPMRVESVAWISERRDLLYGAFYLLALYYYIKAVKFSFRKRYLLIILLSFVLALLSKIQAVALPLSMLAVDYYLGREVSLKLVAEKWFYFLLSLVTGLAGIYFLKSGGVFEDFEHIPILNRVFNGSYAYIVYIIKSVIPYKMAPKYPFPDFHQPIGWMFYASAALSAAILGSIYYFFLKKKKILVFGLLFFTFNVMFVLQIKIGGNAFLADRYTYIAYFGLFFIDACGLQLLLEKFDKFDKLIYVAALVVLSTFAYLNFEQNKIWKNSATLWSHELKYYDQDIAAWANRAAYYNENGRIKEALHDYSKAISLDPNYAALYVRRGDMYFDSNRPANLRLALQDYSKAIELSPGTAAYLLSRGAVYASLNMFVNALEDLDAAARLEPQNYYIYQNRFRIYLEFGQDLKAQADLEKYLDLNPSNPAMWAQLGDIRRVNGQYEKALTAYDRAIQLKPAEPAYLAGRLKTSSEMGNL